ncbi:IS3 family transposase [Psychrobacter sp. HII-4]|uniref:IS3 family transposase n=1 Tax=Psychrobacter sp. HII-4 TaxID=1569264 RepID=UPI00191904DE|nr:IS3 family transposase [Psychrobacter sp. HII-4]
MTTKRGRYSQEFKLEAIKLVEDQGRKIPEVANSLGIGKTTLENWVYKYRKEQQGIMPSEGKALTPELRRIQELEKQVKQLKMERDILKKASGSASPRQSQRLSLITKLAEHHKHISKHKLCELFGVVRSSYYNSTKSRSIDIELIRLKALIREVFEQSNGSAGARTVSAIVTHQHDIKLTRYRAGKLMAQMGLISRQIKSHKYRCCEKFHKVYGNILDRQFAPTAPNQVWTGDVTYIRIKGGWCYLAIVMDLYARRIVGFALSDSPNTQLTTSALKMAYHIRLEPKGVLFHSDQGSHYTSEEYAKCVAKCNGMSHSMSRRGNCWDNAPTERFFRSFKTEWMPKNGYDNIDEARQAVNDYIWGYYQSVRPHSFNEYLTPSEKERLYFNTNLLSTV